MARDEWEAANFACLYHINIFIHFVLIKIVKNRKQWKSSTATHTHTSVTIRGGGGEKVAIITVCLENGNAIKQNKMTLSYLEHVM